MSKEVLEVWEEGRNEYSDRGQGLWTEGHLNFPVAVWLLIILKKVTFKTFSCQCSFLRFACLRVELQYRFFLLTSSFIVQHRPPTSSDCPWENTSLTQNRKLNVRYYLGRENKLIYHLRNKAFWKSNGFQISGFNQKQGPNQFNNC